ncbi:MAG: hypothetical protein Q8M24_18220 [Pseudolabrys sp.]|nr:hypothetical protein [Pseudolabrys sp.]MDP2297383.1 hypothetical protein [Pseudolabrys sp.]
MNYKSIGYAVVVAATAAMFVIGSAVPSEAAKKKKAAAAPAPTPVVCFGVQKPVCAEKGGMKFTYANACYAAKDGAKAAKDGACKPSKAMKGGKKKAKKAAKK